MAKYQEKGRDGVALKFRVPRGKVSNIMGVMNLLQRKFDTLEILLTARDGFISDQDYEEKIKETFTQLGIDVELDFAGSLITLSLEGLYHWKCQPFQDYFFLRLIE